MFPFVRTERAA